MHHYITLIQYTNRNNYLESAVFKSWWTLFPLLCPCFFLCAFGRTQPLFSQHWRAFVSACAAHSWEYLMLMPASGSCTQRAQWCEIMGGGWGGEHLKENWGGRNGGRGSRRCLHRELSTVQLNGEMATERLEWQRCVGGGCMWGFVRRLLKAEYLNALPSLRSCGVKHLQIE